MGGELSLVRRIEVLAQVAKQGALTLEPAQLSEHPIALGVWEKRVRGLDVRADAAQKVFECRVG